jgi:hypothetical protein
MCGGRNKKDNVKYYLKEISTPLKRKYERIFFIKSGKRAAWAKRRAVKLGQFSKRKVINATQN